jgi:tRNA pseudouridine13 synthase
MKDKVAVTTQSISIQAPRGTSPDDLASRARSIALDGITVHDAKRHTNKLKPGHLVGNRFTIVVRGIDEARVGEATASLEKLAREGLPNAFGAQRFGRHGDNAEQAIAWLTGKSRGPRDPRARRFMWSALQSKVFNAVLDARVKDGTWATPLEGDLLKLRSSGGMFLCADVQADRARAATGEVSPTGPIIGVKMRPAEGAAGALEARVAAEILGESFDLAQTKKLGEGSRRVLRLWIEELRFDMNDGATTGKHKEQGASLRVYFVLPKGAYATTVLSSVFALDETTSEAATSTGEIDVDG